MVISGQCKASSTSEKDMYKVYISGQKKFGLDAFRLFQESLEVVGVNAPVGDCLFEEAKLLGIPTYKQHGIVEESDVPYCDLIVCAHSFDYVTQAALNKACFGGIGYHPSLLPKLKGRNAVKRAIELGLKETGGSIYTLTEKWDAGRVIYQEKVAIPEGATSLSLWVELLAPLGLKLFKRLIENLTIFGPMWCEKYIKAYYADPLDEPDYRLNEALSKVE